VTTAVSLIAAVPNDTAVIATHLITEVAMIVVLLL